MSNTTDFNNELETNPACRVAYIYGGEQPVLCTMIGDQPLFYADEVEPEMFDEDFMESSDDLLFKLTHREIYDHVQELREREQHMADQFERDVFADFSSNFAINEDTTLAKILQVFEQSRMAKTLLSHIADYGVTVIANHNIDSVEYDRSSKIISVNTDAHMGRVLVSLAQSVRQSYQHVSGTLVNPMTFAPEDAVVINRAQIADLCVTKVRIAWELNMAGERSAWEAVLNSALSDLAFTFAREIKHNFRNLNNGHAMQMAFEKWYLSDRCKIEDKRLVQMMLADHGGFIFNSEDTSHLVSLDVVMRLGDMPFGANYLRGVAAAVSSDPLYSEIRDRSVANFLWFIKFESAFRDKEEELGLNERPVDKVLQDTDDSDSFENSFKGSPFTKTKNQESRHEEERSGDVIELSGFFAKDDHASRSKLRAGSTASGTVVSLFGSREQ